MARRTRLGSDRDGLIRRQVYDVGDALEVDELMMSTINRTRVYFDDVLLLTYHRMFGTLFVVCTVLGAAFFLGLSLLALSNQGNVASIVFAFMSLPFLVPLVFRLIFQVDIITVFGRRSRARLRFDFRKARARALFRELAGRIRTRQAEVAASMPQPTGERTATEGPASRPPADPPTGERTTTGDPAPRPPEPDPWGGSE